LKLFFSVSVFSLFFLLYLFYSQNTLTIESVSQNLFIVFNIEEISGFPPSNQPSPSDVYTPAYIEELHYKGHELDRIGKYEEAIKVFDEILSINKNYTHALTGKGWVYLHLGNYQEALNWFDKTLALDKNFYFALTGKAEALTNMNQYQEAIPWYDKAISINPNDIEIKNNKKLALSKINE